MFEFYCRGDGDSFVVRLTVSRMTRVVFAKAVVATATAMALLTLGQPTAAEVARILALLAGG
jgi:hypothetical protein